ncbi:MAG: hypothetical protein ACJA0K_000662 [Maricaulis maris]
MGADRQYLESIVEQLYEPSLRNLLEDLRDEVRDLIDPQRTERSTNYTSVFPSMAAVFRWLGTPLDIVTDRKRLSLRSQAVSPEFREMLGRSSRKAGLKSALGIYAWFHIVHPESAERFLARLREQAGPGLTVPEFRELDDPPRLFETWEEYAQVVIPDVLEKTSRESERAAGYGLGLVRPRPAETDRRSALEMRYFNEATKFVGRKRELTNLDHFVKRADTFLWWQIAGPAGQGKSRIALKLVDELIAKGWEAGFVTPFDEEFLTKVESYLLGRPLLLVVDYASDPDRARLLSRLIRALSKLAESRNRQAHPVRLLVIERQPYDGLFEPDYSAHPEKWASPWHYFLFAEDAVATKEIYATVADPKQALSLSPLSDDHLRDVALSWAANRLDGNVLDRAQRDALDEYLRPASRQSGRSAGQAEDDSWHRLRRPLFAILASDAVLSGRRSASDNPAGVIYDLLDFALDHDAQQVFANTGGSRRPIVGFGLTRGSREQQNLALLANITRRLNVIHSVEQLPDLVSDQPDDLEVAHRLLGYPVFVEPGDPGPLLYAREPDLLAEYQVLRWVKVVCRVSEDGVPRKSQGFERIAPLVRHAWAASPSNTFSFIYRTFEDFHSHSTFLVLVGVRPEGDEAIRAWAELLSVLAIRGDTSTVEFALHILESVADETGDEEIEQYYATALWGVSRRHSMQGELKVAQKLFLLALDRNHSGYSTKLANVASSACLWLALNYAKACDVEFARIAMRTARFYLALEELESDDEQVLIWLIEQYINTSYVFGRAMCEASEYEEARVAFEEGERALGFIDHLAHECHYERTRCAIAISTATADTGDVALASQYLLIADQSSESISAPSLAYFRLYACIAIARQQVRNSSIEKARSADENLTTAFSYALSELSGEVNDRSSEREVVSALTDLGELRELVRLDLALRETQSGEYERAYQYYLVATVICRETKNTEIFRALAVATKNLAATIINAKLPDGSVRFVEVYIGDLNNLANQSQDEEVLAIQRRLQDQISALQRPVSKQ